MSRLGAEIDVQVCLFLWPYRPKLGRLQGPRSGGHAEFLQGLESKNRNRGSNRSEVSPLEINPLGLLHFCVGALLKGPQ